jgi:hypothetical protein
MKNMGQCIYKSWFTGTVNKNIFLNRDLKYIRFRNSALDINDYLAIGPPSSNAGGLKHKLIGEPHSKDEMLRGPLEKSLS